MATLHAVAAAHYDYRSTLIDRIDELLIGQWAAVDGRDVLGSWARVAATAADQVTIGQYAAAATATDYVAAAMEAQGVDGSAPPVDPRAFAGVASDGRPLGGLLLSAPLTVLQQIAAGAAVQVALDAGLVSLLMHSGTQIADAGRAADQSVMAATPQVGRWVRMIEPGACSRCAVLAGREYNWQADFERHPRCRCTAIPAAESTADLTTDPKRYFDSLSVADQDRIFTKAGAEAIRNGADIVQVVNARRGMYTATAYGRQVLATREGVTRHGLAGQRDLIRRNGELRLMPEQIFRDATSPADAVRLLREHGYITRQAAPKPPAGAAGGAKPPAPPPRPPTPAAPGPDDSFDRIPRAPKSVTEPDLSPLTQDEKIEVAYYTALSFSTINKLLRSGRTAPPSVRHSIQQIDAGLAKYPLPQTVRVSRGVGIEFFAPAGVFRAEDLPGAVGSLLDELGYLSTTLAARPPAEFLRPGNVVLDLAVPSGTPALAVQALSDSPAERELLIARGQRILVVSAGYAESERRWIVRAVIVR